MRLKRGAHARVHHIPSELEFKLLEDASQDELGFNLCECGADTVAWATTKRQECVCGMLPSMLL